MISLMYRLPKHHITGGPGWLDSELWTADAKSDRERIQQEEGRCSRA